jgi:two-component system, cell cycle sensor histidine kinase and response regulator CckA
MFSQRQISLLRTILWLGAVGLLAVHAVSPLTARAEASRGTARISVTNLNGINTLPRSQSPQVYPFQLRATVLFCDAPWHLLFVSDPSGIGFLPLPPSDTNAFPAGTSLLIEGTAETTLDKPSFSKLKFVKTGATPLPAPHVLTGEELWPTDTKEHWIQFEGIVRNQSTLDRDHVLYEISTRHGRIVGVCAAPARLPRNAVGFTIRVQSVFSHSELHGVYQPCAWIPNLECVKFESTNAPPLITIGEFLTQAPTGALAPRLRIQGRLTAQKLGEFLCLQENTQTVKVLSAATNPLTIGSLIEAQGFAEPESGGRRTLNEAVYKRILAAAATDATPAPPPAIPLNLKHSQTLTRVAQIRDLPRSEAAKELPVRVKAVVTFYSPALNWLFVADDSVGIFVNPGGIKYEIQNGQEVEIEGLSHQGGYAPMIQAREIRGGSLGKLPAAKKTSIEYLHTGLEECQLVSVRGVARQCQWLRERLQISLLSASGTMLKVYVSAAKDDALLAHWLHAGLEIRGVCGAEFTGDGHLKNVVLYVADTNDVKLIQWPSVNPFAEKLIEITEIGQFTSSESLATQKHVQGIVTWSHPTLGFYLQDESAAIHVFPNATNTLAAGDQAEVVGYAYRSPRSYSIGDAQFRKVTNALPPLDQPIEATAKQVTEDASLSGRLVRLPGVVVDNLTTREGWSLTLKSGNIVFRAQGQGDPPNISRESQCEITGVCDLDAAEGEARTFIIRARDNRDARLLRGPPLWRSETAFKILEIMGVLILWGLLWVISLRRRVQQQTRLIRERLDRETQLEARYRDLFENAPDIIFVSDLEGRLLSLNHTARAFWSMTSNIGQPHDLKNLLAPESVPLLSQAVRCLLAGDTLPPVELNVERPEGGKATLEATLRLVKQQQVHVGLECIARDITERKRMEGKLRQLSRAIEQCPTAIFLTTIKGEIEYANPKFTKLTGYSAEEIIGQNARILRSGETSPQVYSDLWDTILAGGEWQGEIHNRKKNGEYFWVHSSISPITNQEGVITHFLAISEDITERRQLEDRLRHAQKMESVGQLASGVAHDFNNILTVIQGHASLLLEDEHARPENTHSAQQIAESARRAADLTRQLLTFSRKQIMKAQTLNLNQLLANLTGMLQPLLGEQIQLQFEPDPALPPIHADTTMIEQVIMNLAVNARDAMPKGGRLRIATFRHPVVPANQSATEIPAGLYAGIRVEDTGCGMDKRTLSHIFEPFFTTKDIGKGTGLGLATVYGIVKQHDGYIEVKSEPNQGTTFHVYIPASNQPEATATAPRNQPACGEGEKILVVEDEPALRKLVKSVLLRNGYQVSEASTGVEALRVWKANRGEFALILTDMVMPEGMNGRELVEIIRAEKPLIKVIYSSGYHVELAGKDFVLRENDRFLPKPYRPDILVQFVRESLDSNGAVNNRLNF